MPNRVLREDLLDSERVHKCSCCARWLYVAIALQADDVGLLDIQPFKLARRAGIPEEDFEWAFQELVDQELVSPYLANGRELAFIPRFRQRLQVTRSRFPLPDDKTIGDDLDALNKINKLRKIQPLSTDVHGESRWKRREGKGREEKAFAHARVGVAQPLLLGLNGASREPVGKPLESAAGMVAQMVRSGEEGVRAPGAQLTLLAAPAKKAPAKKASPSKVPLPDGWAPKHASVARMAEAYKLPADVIEGPIAEGFRDLARANSYAYIDWDAAFRNCLRGDWGHMRSSAQKEAAKLKPPPDPPRRLVR